MMGSVPGVVVVSGLPAAGKSTLAARLSKDLEWVLVSRDQLGTILFEELGAVVPADAGWRIARAKDRLVNTVVGAALDVGAGTVLDGNFNVVEQADAVRSFLAARGAHAAEICLWGDPAVLRQRFIDRATPPLTPDLVPYFDRVLNRERWTVLAPPAPVLQIDTTDLSEIDAAYPSLLTTLQASLNTAGA